ncbi:MAG: 30S ribosomal protein S6 [Sedimentisphaerales bacterium]
MKTVVKKGTPSRKRKTKGEPKLYEAMFLVDSAEAATNWEGVTAAIKNILEKAGAEIVSLRKWDERKLAYEINGKGKGMYILCYFRAEGSKLRDIERDIQLSERIMRVLILCAEQRQAEDIERGSTSQENSEMGTQKQTDEGRKQTEQGEREVSEPVV